MVHRNILAARSPVFASLLAQLEGLEGIKEKTTEKLENIQVGSGNHVLTTWRVYTSVTRAFVQCITCKLTSDLYMQGITHWTLASKHMLNTCLLCANKHVLNTCKGAHVEHMQKYKLNTCKNTSSKTRDEHMRNTCWTNAKTRVEHAQKHVPVLITCRWTRAQFRNKSLLYIQYHTKKRKLLEKREYCLISLSGTYQLYFWLIVQDQIQILLPIGMKWSIKSEQFMQLLGSYIIFFHLCWGKVSFLRN